MHLRSIISTLSACLIVLGGLTAPHGAVNAAGSLSQGALRAEIRAFIDDANACTPHSACAALAAMYAPAPTLRASFHTGTTKVYHGVAQIVAFYKGDSVPGKGFALDSLTFLSPTIVYSYEHWGSPGETSPSSCTHVYVLNNQGKITREEFVEYYPGKGM